MVGWILIEIEIGRNSLLQVDKFLTGFGSAIGVDRFEDLAIPVKIVAADFWARKQVVFDSGDLVPAVAASFALPGIFQPVVLEGRVLVDGGAVNPLPFDLLREECDIVVAVNVMGHRTPSSDDLLPSYTETVFNTFQIASAAILAEKYKVAPPDIYIDVEVYGVKVLDFHKADQIYAQALPAQKQLRSELAARLKLD